MDITHIHSTKNKLATIAKVHGQVIFITDAAVNDNDIYVDFLDTATQEVVRYPLTRKSALFYGICSSAADTVAKEVTIDNFILTTGAWAFVKFTNGNTANSITLNISNTGSKSLIYNGNAADDRIIAGIPYQVIYNGTSYELANIFNLSPDLSMSVNMSNGHLYYDFEIS